MSGWRVPRWAWISLGALLVALVVIRLMLSTWVAGYVIHACFIVLAELIDALGGPDAPPLMAGSGQRWFYAFGWAFLMALAGGLLANSWLRPAGRR